MQLDELAEHHTNMFVSSSFHRAEEGAGFAATAAGLESSLGALSMTTRGDAATSAAASQGLVPSSTSPDLRPTHAVDGVQSPLLQSVPPLQQAHSSPMLGAADSAVANESFFARLLG